MPRDSGLEKDRRIDESGLTRDDIIAERRDLIKKGVYLAGAGALFATTAGSLGAFIPPYVNPFIDGTFDVLFSHSDATSSWANNNENQKMKASDFPKPGLGAQGKIPELAMNVIIAFMVPDKVSPTMVGLVEYGAGTFAAYNAKCKHLGCTALWRTEAEAETLVPVNLDHDFIVCPCHLGTYNIYDSAKVLFGPPPAPLDQLKMTIDPAEGQIKITFKRYAYGKSKQV
jgi:Rieske Fe-S protein